MKEPNWRRSQNDPSEGEVNVSFTGVLEGLRSFVMQDLIFAATTIAFFLIAVGYVHFCDQVK